MTDFGAQCGAQKADLTENRHLEDITEKWPPPRTFRRQEQRNGGTAPERAQKMEPATLNIVEASKAIGPLQKKAAVIKTSNRRLIACRGSQPLYCLKTV